jgi:hypothetical protein
LRRRLEQAEQQLREDLIDTNFITERYFTPLLALKESGRGAGKNAELGAGSWLFRILFSPKQSYIFLSLQAAIFE